MSTKQWLEHGNKAVTLGVKAVHASTTTGHAWPHLPRSLSPTAAKYTGDQGALKPFLGTWTGVCADGKDFVIVTLIQIEGGSLEGTVRLANMRGGDDGHCATVVDPPSDKHALSVTDAKLKGSTLTFKGSKRMEFE